MRWRRIFGLSAAASMISGSAYAADLPVDRNVYVPVVPVVPVVRLFNWTGFYVGGNVGYGLAHDSLDISPNGRLVSIPESLTGAIGGVQVGANWQIVNTVFGIEADVQGSGQSHSTALTQTIAATSLTPTITAISNTDKVTSFGTLRARAGIASNHALAYLTAGLGYLSFSSNVTLAGLGSASFSGTELAGVFGAGMEFAFLEHWTVKAEYLFLQTRNISSSPFAAAPSVVLNARIFENIFRAGVNYLF